MLLNCVLIFCCFGIGQTFCCFFNARLARCNIAYRCSDEENLSWATNGKSCFLFRNACVLANQNCARRNAFAQVLNTISKSDCQLMCKNVCPSVRQPLCATYEGVYRTFANNCELQNYVCNEGKPFSLVHNGACDDALTVRVNKIAA